MKNLSLFCCVLFTGITLYSGEQAKQLELIKSIDCKRIETTLYDDYKSYLQKQLENYKTTDYTPETMRNLRTMSSFMTGCQYGNFPYNVIRDEQGNSFIRIAVKKMDL